MSFNEDNASKIEKFERLIINDVKIKIIFFKLAQYFCSKYDLPKDYYFHYGLAVPLYTHFTSPIRRYPDVLVHRLLAASLGYCEETQRDFRMLQAISENCNDKKYGARVCSERSSEMFFALFINVNKFLFV